MSTGFRTFARKSFAVQALALAQLAIGFLGSVLIARWSIARLGLDGFGSFALLLGYAAVFALCDLGILPGLTATVGARLSAGREATALALVRAASVMTAATWVLLAIVSLAYLHVALPGLADPLTLPLLIFALGSALVSIGDVSATLLRVGGHLEYAYASRLLYQIVWVGGVGLAFWQIQTWRGITILTLVQLFASIVYIIAVGARLRSRAKDDRWTVVRLRRAFRSRSWNSAWTLSGPERGIRLMGALVSLGERSFLMVLGAAPILASYDLLLRISTVVSAVPATLAQPLLAMLASGVAGESSRGGYGDAARHTRRLTGSLVWVGLGGAVVIWVWGAERLFGVRPELPLALALSVFLATAINVQTAPGVAIATVHHAVEIVRRKVIVEAIGVAVAAVLGYALGSALWFIVVRYAALILAAGLFQFQFRKAGLDDVQRRRGRTLA